MGPGLTQSCPQSSLKLTVDFLPAPDFAQEKQTPLDHPEIPVHSNKNFPE